MVLNRWLAIASMAVFWVAGFLVFAGAVAKSQAAVVAPDVLDDPQSDGQQTPSSSPAPASDHSDPPNASPGPSGGDPATGSNQTAEGQLKEQEHQRVFGVMATFNTTRNRDALPLSTAQKYQLFFRSARDPWPFLLNGVLAGFDQAQNAFPNYGQGMEGYAKRFGAEYTDYFTGNLLGNAVLASLLREDPRYFQKGTGTYTGRALWAATSTVWAKRDNGTWGPNYANVLGNLMGAAVSNLYYPESDRTAQGTIERGLSVTAQAIIGSEVIEFWPDLVRYHRRKQAEKLAQQRLTTVGAQNGAAQNTPQPELQPVPAPAASHP